MSTKHDILYIYMLCVRPACLARSSSSSVIIVTWGRFWWSTASTPNNVQNVSIEHVIDSFRVARIGRQTIQHNTQQSNGSFLCGTKKKKKNRTHNLFSRLEPIDYFKKRRHLLIYMAVVANLSATDSFEGIRKARTNERKEWCGIAHDSHEDPRRCI